MPRICSAGRCARRSIGNLLSVAGEWAGWSEDFVRDRVLAAWNARAERFLLGTNRLMPRREWAAVVA